MWGLGFRGIQYVGGFIGIILPYSPATTSKLPVAEEVASL